MEKDLRGVYQMLVLLKKTLKKYRIINIIRYKIERGKSVFNKRGSNTKIINKGILINIKYDIIGNQNKIIIGENSIVSDTTFHIRGNNHEIFIGAGCFYRGNSLWLEGSDCKIIIGDKTTVMDAHMFAEEPNCQIVVGKDCMFSNNIIVRTGDSHSIIDTNINERLNPSKSITIGNHVWIASWVRILKGVKINDNSVIAIGSIVTTDIPGNCIAGGVPAKVIKEKINWLREQI